MPRRPRRPSMWNSRSQCASSAKNCALHCGKKLKGAHSRCSASAGILVFIERGAIEAPQPWASRASRHPIKNHAKARLMAESTENSESHRGAEARGGCVVVGDLIAQEPENGCSSPASIPDGVAQIAHVRDQAVRQLSVAQRFVGGLASTIPDALHRWKRVRARDYAALSHQSDLSKRVVQSQTIDAVRGGASAKKAYGSDFSCISLRDTRNLVVLARPAPG